MAFIARVLRNFLFANVFFLEKSHRLLVCRPNLRFNNAINPFASMCLYISTWIYFPLNGFVGYIYLNFIYF
jgi:hypothetical protein